MNLAGSSSIDRYTDMKGKVSIVTIKSELEFNMHL